MNIPDNLIWPIVIGSSVTIICIFALFRFTSALLPLIGRTTKVGRDGITFERAQDGGEMKPPLLSFDELMKLPMSNSSLAREDAIKQQIHSYNLNDDKKVEILIRILATTRIEIEFNNIAHKIFGSQIKLLLNLASTYSGLQIEKVNEIYSMAKLTYPELHNDRTFDEWLHYVIANNLAVLKDDTLFISYTGLDFLKHLVDARLTYDRYG